MNTSDLTLQMAYLAGQIAQSTLPDIGVSAGRPEQKMDFQALLNEKRTQADRERTEQEPQKTDPSQDTETGKTEQKDEDVAAQAAGQGVPLMLDLSAVLAGGGDRAIRGLRCCNGAGRTDNSTGACFAGS